MKGRISVFFLILWLASSWSCSKDSYIGEFARIVRLTVDSGTAMPPAGTLSPTATGISVLQIAVTAGPDEQIKVTSIRFTESGTGNAQTAIASIGLYVDEDRDGSYSPAVDTVTLGSIAGGFGVGDTAVFTGIDRIIHPGSTEYWILVYSLSGAAGIGDTFIASVGLCSDVTAVGSVSGRTAQVSGPPVTGNTMTILNFGSLAVSAGPNNPATANIPIPPTTAPMLQVHLEASSTEDVDVTSITFTATGTGNADSDVSSVLLYNDLDSSGTVSAGDVTIGAAATFSGGRAQFSGLSETITSGAANAERWLVVCTFTGGSPGDTYEVSLASNADVSAAGATSALPITPSGAPVPGNTMTIQNIGSLAVSAGPNNPPAGNLPTPPTNVPMFQLNLEAGPTEDVDISSITFTAGGTGNADTAVSSAVLYNDLDSSGTLTAGDVQIGVGAGFTGGLVQFTGLTETITAGVAGAEDWLVLCSFSGGSAGDTFSVSLAANTDVSASGATSFLAITPTGAPVTGNMMTLQIGSLAVSAGPNNPPAGNLPVPPNNVPMFQLNLQAGPFENVNITSITFTAGGTGVPAAAISAVDLYNDLDSSGTLTMGDIPLGLGAVFVGGAVQFTGLTETITAGAAGAEDWLVICTFTGGNLGDTFSVSLTANTDISATGAASTYTITPTGAPVAGNIMTLTAIPLVITTKRLPRAQSGVAYSFTLLCTGGISPYTWVVSSGSLPTGLVLVAGTGVISGTPTAAGQIFTVQVVDSGGPPQNDTQLLAIEVDPAGAVIVSVIQAGGGSFTTITAAVAAIPNPLAGTHIIEIQDNATYTENVDVIYTPMGGNAANVILRSKYDCLPTVQAANANDHVIELQIQSTVCGLKITGATGNGMCGIKALTPFTNTFNCIIYGNDVAYDNSGAFGTNFNNNTCYGPKGIFVGGGGSCMVRNNIIWATGAWGIQWYNPGSYSCDFNLYYTPSGAVGYDGTTFYNTLAAWQAYSAVDNNSQYGNPNLVNPSGGDFHLTPSSALAIDLGITNWGFLIDAEGYARGHGAGWDIGAFERH